MEERVPQQRISAMGAVDRVLSAVVTIFLTLSITLLTIYAHMATEDRHVFFLAAVYGAVLYGYGLLYIWPHLRRRRYTR